VDSDAPQPDYGIHYLHYPHINGLDFAESNSYDFAGLSWAFVRCVHLDRIRYIFCATGKGRRELREDSTLAVHYSNYIFIQSDEDVRTWLLSN